VHVDAYTYGQAVEDATNKYIQIISQAPMMTRISINIRTQPAKLF